MEAFSFWGGDMDRFKCQLKSFYAGDFEKKALNVQEATDIIEGLDPNQNLEDASKLRCSILTRHVTSAICVRQFASLKQVNKYM